MSPTNLIDQCRGKKVGFVLSGGVVRAAAWHLGVALALEELGIHFVHHKNSNLSLPPDNPYISTYVGSSAGALVSTLLASGYGPHEIISAVFGGHDKIRKLNYSDLFYFKRPKIKTTGGYDFSPLKNMPLLTKTLLKPLYSISGFFSTEGLRKYLLDYYLPTDSFDKLAADLFIVSTQLDHSRKVIFSKYNYPNTKFDSTAVYYTGFNISHAAASSMSVPPFYSPYPIYNPVTKQVDYYIDGEIRETLSHHVAIDNGCEVIINSWTHTPYHYHDEIGSLVHYGIPSILVQTFYLMIQKKIITERSANTTAQDLINTIGDYMISEKMSKKQIREVTSILERKLNYRSNILFIDIFPDHHDYELFFTSFFSLDKEQLTKIVRAGYKATKTKFYSSPDPKW